MDLVFPGSDKSEVPPARFIRRLKIGILALNASIAFLLAMSLYESHKFYQREAETTAKNLAALLSHGLSDVVDKIDQALLSVMDEVNEELKIGKIDANRVNALVARLQMRLPELEAVRVTDAQGQLKYGTDLGTRSGHPVNIGDREYFGVLRHQADAGVAFSGAITSRVSQKPVIVMARRISQADGSFAGVVIAPISLEKITQQMAQVDAGRNGVVTLSDLHSAVIARYPSTAGDHSFIGQTIQTPERHAAYQLNPGSGVFHARSSLDQIQRTFAYHKVGNFPFLVSVGLAEADYLAEWRQELARSVIVLLLLILVTSLLTRWIISGWTRREIDLQVIKKQEQKFRHLLDSTPDPLIFTDQKGRIVMANRQVTRLFGYQPEELLGKPVEILIPQRHRGHHPDLRRGYVKAPTVREMSSQQPLAALTKQGREVPVTISLSPIETEQGLLVAAAIRDITQQKAIEEALRTNTNRLIESQSIAQLGSWTLDLASGKLDWSPEVFRLFELEPGQFDATYKGFLNAVHPEDRDAVNRAYQESLVNRLPYEITHRLRMHDGRIKWVQERCVTEFNAAGKPLRSQGTVQNVTERMQAEMQLSIAATAFESQESMMITDANRVILRVNSAFTEETGYTAEDVVGKPAQILRSGRHDDDFYAGMQKVMYDTGRWQGEVWGKRKNGEVYPKFLSISAVKAADGAVTHFVTTHSDITERKKAEAQIVHLAYHDVLTGLPNRRLMMDRLDHARSVSARTGHCVALLLLDLDNFKTLNDTLGHEMGDLLLKEVALRLRSCVREVDTVARLGGDEFVVLLEDLSPDFDTAAKQAENVGEKIRNALSAPFVLSGNTLRSTPSIGATLFHNDEITIEELMKQADLAMYQAKAAGRNTIRFFDPAMQTKVAYYAALEADLREALQQQQFLLHYQPQINDAGLLVGVEVLLRWQHPERGMVSPMDFIPLAEESGLILPLGKWVLKSACAQLVKWQTMPNLAQVTIAINISASQLHHPGFVNEVVSVLEETGANPKRLKLELTESQLVTDAEVTIAKMLELQNRGVGFSMDDFGTGYSSLSYLKRLPLDQLKIDKSFVDNILSDSNDAAIAKMIVALAESTNLNVIAEGVETQAQRDFLSGLGCHTYQGYLFSRPLPLADFELLAPKFT